MRTWCKIISLAMLVGAVSFHLLLPGRVGLAAPASLPSCGHNSVPNSINSGPPDLARSTDNTTTAMVWAEGTDGIGQIRLVYSDALTTTRIWRSMTIDAGTTNKEPTVVFDPGSTNLVHVAYQKGLAAGGSVITYARCTLGGACTTSQVSTGNKLNVLRSRAKIAVNSAGAPLIVYQESKTGGNPSSWLNYAYVQTGGTGAVSQFEGGGGSEGINQLGNGAPEAERNPTIVAAGNTIHVAYAADANNNGATDTMRYLQLNAATLSGALPGATSVVETFAPNTVHATEPDLPSIDALNSTVVLVWQVKRPGGSSFGLAYNTSLNNGVAGSWIHKGSGSEYRYIPSDRLSLFGPDAGDDLRFNSNTVSDEFRGLLYPAISLQLSGATPMTHLVWHDNKDSNQGRTDIMYTYFDGTRWRGTPLLVGESPAMTLTNVTYIYGESEESTENLGVLSKSRPALLFGPPGNRLQVVYLSSRPGGSRQLRYNGWQLGDGSSADPSLQVKDTDCDTRADTVEIIPDPIPTSCDALGADFIIDGNHFNCDNNFDAVPDFMDTNSDGDFQDDDVDDNPYEHSDDGATFLPLIFKTS